jgi:hypothetical protein
MSRYLGHPVMFPRSTWLRRLWCGLFGHDPVEWYRGAPPRCYDCGAHLDGARDA